MLKYDQNTTPQLNLIDIKLLKKTIYNYGLDRVSGSVIEYSVK